jgi:cyclopropane fatty-acyl-phospholipid synthase-like methyltransferase
MAEVMDWDAAYRNEVFAGPPPWNIGEAQPEMVSLVESGAVRSPVLDVGCGVGDVTLLLAAEGYEVIGVDLSSVAIAAATKSAEERGLAGARFVRGDVRELSFDEEFNTVIDCTLFHSLPVEARDDYLQGVRTAAAPGATLFMLVFTTDALPPDSPFPVPNLVTEAEVRDAVSKYWEVEDLRKAFVSVQLPDVPNLPEHDFEVDALGRVKLPALLLTARKR